MDKNAKTMPYSLEAEQSLLGCILIDNAVAIETTSEFHPEDFFSVVHKSIFAAMQKIAKASKPVDLVTLGDELDNAGQLAEVGGYEYLTSVMQAVPGASNYRYYADIVKRDSMRRRLIEASARIADEAFKNDNENSALAFAEKSIYDISMGIDTSTLVSLSDSFADVIVRFNKLQSDKNAFRGLMTGFTALDNMTNGFQPGDLVLIAARPSVGKTSFACNIIENISVYGGGVSAVFSLEMSKLQLAQRMICSVANVSMERAVKGQLTKKDWEELWKANELVTRAKMFVDDSSLITPREMLSKCRRLKALHGLDVIMVDYIQLMQGDSKGRKEVNRQQEVSEISRTLKMVAKELEVPVIALSQLSRAAEMESRPQLSHLRESGAIEQDADIVMFIHRPDRAEKNQEKVQKGEIPRDVAEIIMAKHRNGPVGSVNLKWIGEMTKFTNIARDSDYLEKTYNLSRESAPEARTDDGLGGLTHAVSGLPQDGAGQTAPLLSDGDAPPFDADGEYIKSEDDAMF